MKTKTQNDGKFLVGFCNRVYALSNLFGDQVEAEFVVKRLPEIEEKAFEVRSARGKMDSIYGKVEGVEACLRHVDEVLYRTEKFILTAPMDMEEATACRDRLRACAGGLSDIWYKEYYSARRGQRRLEAGREYACSSDSRHKIATCTQTVRTLFYPSGCVVLN